MESSLATCCRFADSFGCTCGTVSASAEAYLCVKAKADPDPARGLDGDVTCHGSNLEGPGSLKKVVQLHRCVVTNKCW